MATIRLTRKPGGCSWGPSEFSVGLLAAMRYRFACVLSEFAPRSEFQPGEVPRYWFRDPTLPLAVSSALWFSFTGPRRAPLSVQCALSSSSAFLQSLAQPDLADQPQPISTSHGLSVPTALEGSEVHLPRALPQPATFRPQGLVTLSAAYSLRARAGLFSCRRRSWDSPFGAFSSRKVSAAFPGGSTHTPFFPSVFPAAKRWAGPTGRGLWVLTLPGVPRARRRVSTIGAGCSLGLHPLRACGWGLARALARAPPSRFANDLAVARRRPGVSIRPSLASSADQRTGRRTGNPHRVLAPEHTRVVRAKCRPGYFFTSRRVVHCCRPPTFLGRSNRSTGVARVGSEVPSEI